MNQDIKPTKSPKKIEKHSEEEIPWWHNLNVKE